MSAQIFLLPYRPAIGPNSLVIAGAQLFFYQAGTLTKTSVYADAAFTTPLANPVVSNGVGVWPTIYLDTTVSYRVVLKDDAGTTLSDVDPYVPGSIDALSSGTIALINAGVAAAAVSATSAATSATTALSVGSPNNGTLARWLNSVATIGGTASANNKTALDGLSKELWSTGAISDVVYLNMRFGDIKATTIPFVGVAGVGADTGTISSWTEATGLASATLDTGVKLEETGCIEQGCFMGMYALNDFTDSGAPGYALMGRYVDPDAAYGLRVDSTLIYFDGYYGAGGRVSANRRKALGGALT